MQTLSMIDLDRVVGGNDKTIPQRKPPEPNPASLCGEKGLDYQVTVRNKEGDKVWERTVCKQ